MNWERSEGKRRWPHLPKRAEESHENISGTMAVVSAEIRPKHIPKTGPQRIATPLDR
jgi:hypothetical protein